MPIRHVQHHITSCKADHLLQYSFSGYGIRIAHCLHDDYIALFTMIFSYHGATRINCKHTPTPAFVTEALRRPRSNLENMEYFRYEVERHCLEFRNSSIPNRDHLMILLRASPLHVDQRLAAYRSVLDDMTMSLLVSYCIAHFMG